jgi:acyl carrier protein
MSDPRIGITNVLSKLLPDGAVSRPDDDVSLFRSVKIEELDLDSLELLELVMRFEDRLSIELDEDRVMDCKCLGELVDLAHEVKMSSQ